MFIKYGIDPPILVLEHNPNVVILINCVENCNDIKHLRPFDIYIKLYQCSLIISCFNSHPYFLFVCLFICFQGGPLPRYLNHFLFLTTLHVRSIYDILLFMFLASYTFFKSNPTSNSNKRF